MPDTGKELTISLSIVFPAFEEEKKIVSDILRASKFLEANRIVGEIIVVDDGSKDDTYNKALELRESLPTKLILLKHDQNLGKGFAVKSGISHASKDLILYSDVGDTVPFENSIMGINRLLSESADIANGSRKLPNSVIIRPQDSDRKVASWLFNKFIKSYLHIPQKLTDTQCGFKIYKREIGQELFSALKTNGFLFEIEIILRAIENNYKIIEFPIEWKCDRDSRINFWDTTPDVIGEVLKLRRMFK